MCSASTALLRYRKARHFSKPHNAAFHFQRMEVTVRQISLSQGKSVVVDDADFPLLNAFKWSYRGERNGKQGYAVRHCTVDGVDRLCYMHRQLLPAPPGHEV